MRTALRLAILGLPTALALAACGDDGKVGSRGAPAAAPGGGPAVPAAPGTGPAVPSPVPTPPAGGGPVASTPDAPTARFGDWAAWEIRVAGTEGVTKVSWRVKVVDGTRARFTLTSDTLDAQGKVLSHVETEESRTAADGPMPAGAPEVVTVAGRDVATVRTELPEGTIWRSREVPLGGLVRSKGPGGVEQVLVGFGRGG